MSKEQDSGEEEAERALLPVLRLLLVHPLLPLFEQPDGSFGFLHQAVDVDFEVLVLAELGQPLVLLVFAQDETQVLVGVGQDVQDVRRAVFQLEPGVLAQTDLHRPK